MNAPGRVSTAKRAALVARDRAAPPHGMRQLHAGRVAFGLQHGDDLRAAPSQNSWPSVFSCQAMPCRSTSAMKSCGV